MSSKKPAWLIRVPNYIDVKDLNEAKICLETGEIIKDGKSYYHAEISEVKNEDQAFTRLAKNSDDKWEPVSSGFNGYMSVRVRTQLEIHPHRMKKRLRQTLPKRHVLETVDEIIDATHQKKKHKKHKKSKKVKREKK